MFCWCNNITRFFSYCYLINSNWHEKDSGYNNDIHAVQPLFILYGGPSKRDDRPVATKVHHPPKEDMEEIIAPEALEVPYKNQMKTIASTSRRGRGRKRWYVRSKAGAYVINRSGRVWCISYWLALALVSDPAYFFSCNNQNTDKIQNRNRIYH